MLKDRPLGMRRGLLGFQPLQVFLRLVDRDEKHSIDLSRLAVNLDQKRLTRLGSYHLGLFPARPFAHQAGRNPLAVSSPGLHRSLLNDQLANSIANDLALDLETNLAPTEMAHSGKRCHGVGFPGLAAT